MDYCVSKKERGEGEGEEERRGEKRARSGREEAVVQGDKRRGKKGAKESGQKIELLLTVND